MKQRSVFFYYKLKRTSLEIRKTIILVKEFHEVFLVK